MVQESLQRRLETWRWGVWWPPLKVDKDQLRAIIEADLLTIIQEAAEELNCEHSTVFQNLKQIEKGKKLDKWVPPEPTANQTYHHFSVIFSCSIQQHWTVSQPDFDMQRNMDFLWQSVMTSSVGGLRRNSIVLPKPRFAPKKGPGHCSEVCYQWEPLQLFESQQNHYIWEVCETNRWDALKTARPAAALVNRKGPILLHDNARLHVVQPTLQMLNEPLCKVLPHLPFHLTSCQLLLLLQASWQLFAGKTFSQPARGRKYFPTVCRILLKHGFLCYRNKQTHFSMAKMFWL